MFFKTDKSQIGEKERYQARITIIASIVSVIIGAFLDATLVPIVSNYINTKKLERMTPYELLDEGYSKYSEKDYLAAVNIYNNEELKNNPEALNNLGYFYAKGIGVEKDMNKAKDYFAEAKKIDRSYTSGFAAVNVIAPQDIDVTYGAIMDSLNNGDQWTCLFINSLLLEAFPEKDYDYNTFLDMSKKDKIDVLELGIRTEYEWNSETGILENDFYKKIVGADQSIKERIGIAGKTGEVLYGTVTYGLYRKKSFNNLSIIENGIEFKYTPIEEDAKN